MCMREAYHYLVQLPEQCSRMTYEQLLLFAALITLVVAVILMISGREMA